ncbi:MAG: NAD(P)-dependent oxidoreductase [Burkholderiales bacterium]|nr:NAD(P)-dependent oxidoreductase [Burkholderiales bacterium]
MPPDGTRVGVVGAGAMGGPAARTLAAAGFPVRVYDPSASARAALQALAGVEVVTSLAELGRGADIVLMYLPGPQEVAACVPELIAHARTKAAIVDQSTVDPETSQRMSALATAKSISYVDAPVLGRPASIGKWTLVAGGSEADIERCRPVLQALAASIVHVGPAGSGNKVKLLNQLMFGAINAMTAEMMAIAAHMGLSPELLYQAITGSNAATVSNLFRELGARIAAGDYDRPTFSIDLLAKDVRLAADMAKAHGAPPIVARGVELLNEAARAQGLGKLDTAAMWKVYAGIWGGR